jgi:hypothetical protein
MHIKSGLPRKKKKDKCVLLLPLELRDDDFSWGVGT